MVVCENCKKKSVCGYLKIVVRRDKCLYIMYIICVYIKRYMVLDYIYIKDNVCDVVKNLKLYSYCEKG